MKFARRVLADVNKKVLGKVTNKLLGEIFYQLDIMLPNFSLGGG